MHDARAFDLFKMKKNKILNFALCTKKKRSKVSSKVQELKVHRDLFARVLGIALS